MIGILPLSDLADEQACLRVCLQQMNAQLIAGDAGKGADGSATSLYHAYDAVDRTHFTFMLAPPAMRRDPFFALEVAQAVDIVLFAVQTSADNDLSALIDEVCNRMH